MDCESVGVIRHRYALEFAEGRTELEDGFLSLFQVPDGHHDVLCGFVAAVRSLRCWLLAESHRMLLRDDKPLNGRLQLVMEKSLLLKL